ncbi:hypothetical protein BOW53_05635 [Solemya pervernicosa gill symbiont]|uniref:DUF2946 domain-containing protein n=1 Tax=Solemya pervernicosa gill symbiont TaxID=642797 RepID=A0A1T2L7J3_9GAMM|nr:hypothetical protein [Solemya pervernicosa gill symbiont]OOZ41004.1 hypothetical protein BOW53_05635 [Solemya pervernicosa gill symbiont]
MKLSSSPSLRLLIVTLLIAVVFAQAHLLEHEIEHAIHGDNESCASCELGGHLAAALSSATTHCYLSAATPPPVHDEYGITQSHTRLFSPRAPPHLT